MWLSHTQYNIEWVRKEMQSQVDWEHCMEGQPGEALKSSALFGNVKWEGTGIQKSQFYSSGRHDHERNSPLPIPSLPSKCSVLQKCSWPQGHMAAGQELLAVRVGPVSTAETRSRACRSWYYHPLLLLSTFPLKLRANFWLEFFLSSPFPFLDSQLSLQTGIFGNNRGSEVCWWRLGWKCFSKTRISGAAGWIFDAVSSQPRILWPQLCPFATGFLFQMLSACCSGAEKKNSGLNVWGWTPIAWQQNTFRHIIGSNSTCRAGAKRALTSIKWG